MVLFSDGDNNSNGEWYGVDQKKLNFDLDQLERYGFSQGVQHVAINTF